MYLLVKVLCHFYSIPVLSKWVPDWEIWPVFSTMILVVLKDDLELTTMLMLIITICTATPTKTVTPGNFLICYSFPLAKHFMWIFSNFFFYKFVHWRQRFVHAQSCLTLRDATDCSPPGSSVYGIFQWSGLPFPTGIKPTSPASPALASRFFTTEPVHWILLFLFYKLIN